MTTMGNGRTPYGVVRPTDPDHDIRLYPVSTLCAFVRSDPLPTEHRRSSPARSISSVRLEAGCRLDLRAVCARCWHSYVGDYLCKRQFQS